MILKIMNMFKTKSLNRPYTQYPIISDMGAATLKKTRAANKKAAFGLSKNLKDPKFRATEKIGKYKKQQYFG